MGRRYILFKWCSDEVEPFRSRCIFLKMNIPLKHRINSEDFKYLADSGKEFIYLLTWEDINFLDSLVVVKIIQQIFVYESHRKETASVSESAIKIYSILLTLDRSGKCETIILN